MFNLVYPENRVVSEDWIMQQYDDAVANSDCSPGAITVYEMIEDLEDAGLITVDNRVK